MMKRFLAGAALAAGLSACANPQDQPRPDVWTVNYNVGFDSMVACLAAPAPAGYQVYAPGYPEAGMARIVFMPANTPQARSEYVVLKMVGNVSQVSWRRFGQVGGYDWLDNEARRRADNCSRNL